MYNDNKMLRVGIYLRLSNEDKDKINKEDASESIKNQKNMLTDYINKHPYFSLVDTYCDEDLSGAGTYRPQFERLINDCENKKLDIVLCKSQSRFSRDMEIVEKYINNKFKEWNIRFIGLSDNADTEILGNKKSRQINGLVNEWYLEDVSNNIRSAFDAKMRHGEFISPFAPFGYEIKKDNNNKLVIDIIASKIVKKIFDLYLTGLGFTGIAKYLNNKNIPSPSFYKYQKGIKLNVISNRPREQIKWSANAIKTILTNEVYLGNLIQGKRTTISYKNHKVRNKDKTEWIKRENTHEAIIDKNAFYKVQTAIKERTKPISKSKSVHIFSGKVFCLECNNYMRKKNSSRHEYLVCSNNHDGYNDCINKTSIRYDALEKVLLEEINKKILKFYDIEVLKKHKLKDKVDIKKDHASTLIVQKKDTQKKLSKYKDYLKKAYEDRMDGVITNEQFKILVKEYSKDQKIYSKQLESINHEIINYTKKEETISDFSLTLNKYIPFKSLNRIIVEEFIQKIYIGKLNNDTNKRDIKIIWNFKAFKK